MAKRTQPSKDKKAKETVSNLLKDVMPKKEEKKDKMETAVEAKGNEWLQKQVDALTKENEQLREDYNKLLNETKTASSSEGVQELQNGVRALFTDIENAYLGRNPERVRYDKAFNKVLLDKFVGTFQFLQKK
jgi:hypothetical protein